jgi:hypothetical protein
MTASQTRSSRLARILQEATGLTYAQALAVVHRAREDNLLPRSLDSAGMAAAQATLIRAAGPDTPLEGPGYDNLKVFPAHQTPPSFGDQPGYLVFDMIQQVSGSGPAERFVKVVRLGTPEPRSTWLAEQPASFIPEAQRDVLAAIGADGVLFICLVARVKNQPLLFAYGAQGVGETLAQAREKADANWDLLTIQLAGQLEMGLTPLSPSQVSSLAAAQRSWNQVAMVRGRPAPRRHGATQAQLDAFLDGSTAEFILTLLSVPLQHKEMTLSWRNINVRLSEIKAGLESSRATPRPTQDDESAAITARLLEAQLRCYQEGIEEGAHLCQMFLAAPDPTSLWTASAFFKSAFWSPAMNSADFPHPLHIVESFDEEEAARLLTHARAFSSDRRPDAHLDQVEPFMYSTYLTHKEVAAFTHPPRTPGTSR